MDLADSDPPADPDELIQVNVRLPRGLRDEMDARRAVVNGGMSRDKWVAAAVRFALRQPPPGRATPTGPGMRVAPPPHRR